MSNPLIAPTQDSTKAYSGISLLESANDLSTAIESGDWASVAMGAVGTALDALSMAMDPFGAILAAGVSWLMEHVGPLKDALNGLTGNADQIKAQSETWANVAKELGSVASDLNDAINADLQSWSGSASDAYRQRGQDLATSLQAAQKGCDGASSGVKTAGEVVAAVRTLVRDIISELIGHMISWALQVVFTLGIGLAWVVPQVVSAVAKTASQITGLVTKLVKALKALVPLLKKAGTLFEDAGKAFKGLKGGKVAPPPKAGDLSGTPKAPPVKTAGDGGGTPKGGGYEGTPKDYTPPPGKSSGDDSTSASGYTGDPKDYTPPPGKTGDDSVTPSGDHSTPDTTTTSSTGSSSSSGTGGGTPPPVKTDPPPLDTGGGSPGTGGGGTPKGGGGTPKSTPPPNKPSPPRDRAVGKDDRVCASDPVDVATGEMILDQTDLVLPLDLEVSIARTHVSSYHSGRWFGRSWASTVDQRLEVDAEDVCYFSPDGMVLVYPLPAPGTTALPVEGPRLPLTRRLDGGYVLEEPLRGTSLRFDPVPGERAGVLPLTALTGAGQRLDIDYDRTAAPVRFRHSDGYHVELTTERGRITALSVVDPDTGVSVAATRYGYDTDGRLTQVVNSSGRPMLFDYDTQGRVTGWQDRNGTWYRYVYDAAGRCVKTVGDKGFRDGAFAYDRERLVTTYTDSLGHHTEYHLNAANQVVREVDPAGHATVSTWDRYDRLLTRTDPLGHTTTYEYDTAGALSRVARPDGSVVHVHLRDDAVAAISVRDGERTWTRTYDEPPDPFAGPLGVAAVFRPEAAESAAAVPDAVAAAEQPADAYVPDMFGRPALLDAPGGQVRLEWTVEGLRAARVGPGGGREQWTYDGEGNDLTHVDEVGAVTRREYGAFDVVVATVDAAGGRTTYAYDTELRLVAVTNPVGLTWRYLRDHAGRVTEERDFDGRTLRFEYDAAGRLARSLNGLGELTEYTHDTLGNVVARRTPHGLTTYSYDPVGRLRRAENGDAVVEYERDERGRVVAQTTNGRTTTFAYGPDGRSVRRRTPSGVDSVWSFGDNGAPAGLAGGGHVLAFGRDAAGRETGRTVDGTVVLTQAFDAEQRLTGQDTKGRQRRYDYRPDGHLVRATDSVTGSVQFQLDAAGRVVEAVAPDRHEGYRYDAAGNIVSSGSAGFGAAESGPRGYSGNTLATAGVLAYRYDAQGRVVQRRVGELVWHFGWDAQDRMTAVTTPDGTRWRYRYDPLGRRIAKQRLGPGGEVAELVEFVWDGGKLVEEVHRLSDGSTRVRTWDYDPDTDAPVAQHENTGRTRLFHTIVTDPVGRPTELLDAAGDLRWQGRTTVWGRDLPDNGGATATPLRFPGQYLDAETGLHYNVYRYYDPAAGRYVSQDPLGLVPAPNPVAYVSNPLRVADPLGLAPSSCKSAGSSEGDLGVPNRAGSSNDPAHVGDTESTANPSRSASPEPESADITDQAAPPHQPPPAQPDFSHNPAEAPGYVYHGSGAPPDVVFKQGLTSDAIRNNRPPIYDIDTHQHRSYGSGSGYVSTSGNYNTGVQFVPIKPNGQVTEGADWWGKGGTQYHGHDGYVYTIKGDANTMVHLPSHPGRVQNFDGQDEWAAVDHIPGSQIVGANKITGNYNVQPFGAPGEPPKILPAKNGIQSEWIPNNDYQP